MSQHIERINAWTCYNAYAWIPFFTHAERVFRVISLEDWVFEWQFSNHRVKVGQTRNDCVYHLHHITNTGIYFLPFWLLVVPLALSLSSWLFRTHILQCLKLVAIWPSMSLDSTMMTKVLSLRTFLCLQKRLPFFFGLGHNWIWRLCQNLLSNHVWLFLNFHTFNMKGCNHRFFGFNKLHLLRHISA